MQPSKGCSIDWFANCLAGSVEGRAASTPAEHADTTFAAGIRSARRSGQGAGRAGDGAAAAPYDVEEGFLVCVWCGQRRPDFPRKCGAQYYGVACQKAAT